MIDIDKGLNWIGWDDNNNNKNFRDIRFIFLVIVIIRVSFEISRKNGSQYDNIFKMYFRKKLIIYIRNNLILSKEIDRTHTHSYIQHKHMPT